MLFLNGFLFPMVILLATKQMGQKGILVSADNSCKIILRITVRIIPDFEHPELFEMFQAPRNQHIYSSNALIKLIETYLGVI